MLTTVEETNIEREKTAAQLVEVPDHPWLYSATEETDGRHSSDGLRGDFFSVVPNLDDCTIITYVPA